MLFNMKNRYLSKVPIILEFNEYKDPKSNLFIDTEN